MALIKTVILTVQKYFCLKGSLMTSLRAIPDFNHMKNGATPDFPDTPCRAVNEKRKHVC